jgi:hypothetical protein
MKGVWQVGGKTSKKTSLNFAKALLQRTSAKA